METVGATGQDFPKPLPVDHSWEAGRMGARRVASGVRRRRGVEAAAAAAAQHPPDVQPLLPPRTRRAPPSAAVRCPAPVSFENGLYTPRLGSHPVGGNLSFECEDGFVLRGSPVRRCRPNGVWDGETAVCDNGGECAGRPGAGPASCPRLGYHVPGPEAPAATLPVVWERPGPSLRRRAQKSAHDGRAFPRPRCRLRRVPGLCHAAIRPNTV